jgi:DNA polymerase I-like protein with 3'-5' exonuclease and polymerase domains
MLIVANNLDTRAQSFIFKLFEGRPYTITNDTSEVENHNLIFIVGGRALDKFKALKIFPKNRTLNSLTGRTHFVDGRYYIVTFDPTIIYRDYGKLPIIKWCANLAKRIMDTGNPNPRIGDYRYVDDFSECLEILESKHKKTGKPADYAIDLETIGLDPYAEGVRIVSLSITPAPGVSHVYYVPEDGHLPEHVRLQLIALFQDKKYRAVGANLKFDLLWIRVHWGLEITNFSLDTLLLGSLIDENRSNSLNMLAKEYCPDLGGYDDEFNAKFDKGKMHLIPKPDLLTYAGGDTDATYRVAQAERKIVARDKKLVNFYHRILHPAMLAFHDIEYRGVVVDRERYESLKLELEQHLAEVEAEALSLVGRRIRVKYADNLSLTRRAIISDYLFTAYGLNLKPLIVTEKSGQPATNKEHMEALLREYPTHSELHRFCELLNEYNSAKKTLSTYVIGFIKHIRSDGKFHPSYMLFHGDYNGDDSGTVTGRLACKDPAMQCCTGDTLVYTRSGWVEIEKIVTDYESGSRFEVLTHDGTWRNVIGVYRNGVRPVLKVTTESGLSIRCTHNHPILTEFGFIQAGKLVEGLVAWRLYEASKNSSRIKGRYADSNSGFRNKIQREEKAPFRMGGGVRVESSYTLRQIETRVEHDSGPHHARQAKEAGFINDRIVSIEPAGEEHTFDLTIEGSHSFVANGIVVHNTLPKHTRWAGKLREVYVPPPGYAILNADYSQGELRVAACLANEPTMIEAYRTGKDLHALTASDVLGITYDELMALNKDERKAARQRGKAGNFGLLYGMSAEGFMNYAKTSYGVIMSLEEAEHFRNAFFRRYKKLVEWHNRYKEFARNHGYVRSPLGRIRHLPLIKSPDNEQRSKAERQAINAPVQSTLSDMALYAISIIRKTMPDVWVWGMTHDSISCYVQLDRVLEYATRIKHIMENLPLHYFDWHPQIKFTSDVEISLTNLAECVEVNLDQFDTNDDLLSYVS